MPFLFVALLQVGGLAGRRSMILPVPPPRPAGQRPRKKMVIASSVLSSHSLPPNSRSTARESTLAVATSVVTSWWPGLWLRLGAAAQGMGAARLGMVAFVLRCVV